MELDYQGTVLVDSILPIQCHTWMDYNMLTMEHRRIQTLLESEKRQGTLVFSARDRHPTEDPNQLKVSPVQTSYYVKRENRQKSML